jgi:hypothetical protein
MESMDVYNSMENEILSPVPEKRICAEKWFSSDWQFNQLYPVDIQLLARMHWTPLDVARLCSNFLVSGNEVRILDVGSGVGKFCLASAFYNPEASFYGIEQRQNLTTIARSAKDTLRLKNAHFIHGNFTQVDFRNYDNFYFFNAFYENVSSNAVIDDTIDYSVELFNYYTRYLHKQLDQKPVGTRVATYHSLGDEIPGNYHLVGNGLDDLLKFWIKE